jgi:hypothetical protein
MLDFFSRENEKNVVVDTTPRNCTPTLAAAEARGSVFYTVQRVAVECSRLNARRPLPDNA